MGSSGASAENFCLRWNDFESNVSGAFRDLRADADFFDVTLACDSSSGRTLRAHKVILSACSTFFKQMLRNCVAAGQQNPMIYLRGVRLADLESVLDFIYHGEVNVSQDDLNSFLSVAEDLQIKGLTQQQQANNKEKGKVLGTTARKVVSSGTVGGQPAAKRARKIPPSDGNSEDIKEVIKSEPPLDGGSTSTASVGADPAVTSADHSVTFDSSADAGEGPSGFGDDQYDEDEDEYGAYGTEGEATPDASMIEPEIGGVEGQDSTKDLDRMIDSYIERVDKNRFVCRGCGKVHQSSIDTRRHVESQHIEMPRFKCDHCGRTYKTRNSLRVHRNQVHRVVRKSKNNKTPKCEVILKEEDKGEIVINQGRRDEFIINQGEHTTADGVNNQGIRPELFIKDEQIK